MSGLEKEPYETEAKEVSGYKLVLTPVNASGEMTVEKITVTDNLNNEKVYVLNIQRGLFTEDKSNAYLKEVFRFYRYAGQQGEAIKQLKVLSDMRIIVNNSVGVKSSAAGMACFFEADARRSVQLADDDSFGSVDDKGTAIGHHRDFADIDVLVDNGIFIFKSEINMKRGTVGIAVLYAVHHVLFREAHGIGDKLQNHLFVKTFNGKNFIEDFLESLVFPFFCRNIKLKE